MKEIYRTNDPVTLSWLSALMSDAGIDPLLLDTHTSVMEGSIGAIQRRLMVADDDYTKACALMSEAGIQPAKS